MSISFENPTIVTIVVKSAIADFQLPGYGWVDEFNLKYLPPYPTTRAKVIEDIKLRLSTLAIVPWDSLTVMEGALSREHLDEVIAETVTQLSGGENSYHHATEHASSPDEVLEVKVTIEERTINPSAMAIIKRKKS